MRLQVVEVEREFQVHGYTVSPGARVMAWSKDDQNWVVYFNGNDVPVSPGTVYPLGTPTEDKRPVEVYSSARLEQYQLAPPTSDAKPG